MGDDKPDNREILAAAVLFGLFALAGAWLTQSAINDFARARASGGWPTAEAVVLSEGEGASLRYAYVNGGARLIGDRLAFATRGKIGSPPDTTPGARVTVYVDPKDPTIAVLVPGGSGRRFALWFAAGVLVAFAGVAGLVRAMMAIDFPEFAGPREAFSSSQPAE